MKNISFALFLSVSNLLCAQLEFLSRAQIIAAFHEHGIVRYGNFALKSGAQSSTYIDMRRVISYPQVFSSLGMQLKKLIEPLSFDLICGVPYGAVPMATMMALLCQKPLIMCRKESKEHGTKNMIEGNFKSGDSVLVIEDVITTGSSVIETIERLEQQGLRIAHIIVLVDRQQTGVEILRRKGYNVHALFTLSELCQTH